MRILVVDDDATVRSYVALCLRREGHETLEAHDGRSGLATLDSGNVDLVITDIFMPQSDGIEMLRTMRAQRRTLPIIAMSGGGRQVSQDFLTVAMAFGANAILNKPFAPAKLLEAITGAIADFAGKVGHAGTHGTVGDVSNVA